MFFDRNAGLIENAQGQNQPKANRLPCCQQIEWTLNQTDKYRVIRVTGLVTTALRREPLAAPRVGRGGWDRRAVFRSATRMRQVWTEQAPVYCTRRRACNLPPVFNLGLRREPVQVCRSIYVRFRQLLPALVHSLL